MHSTNLINNLKKEVLGIDASSEIQTVFDLEEVWQYFAKLREEELDEVLRFKCDQLAQDLIDYTLSQETLHKGSQNNKQNSNSSQSANSTEGNSSNQASGVKIKSFSTYWEFYTLENSAFQELLNSIVIEKRVEGNQEHQNQQ